MKPPFVVVDVFGGIVSKVSEILLPTLREFDDKIEAVNYLYGHPIEIIETLGQRDKSSTFQFKKYPLVALFQDFPERHGNVIGLDSTVTLNIIIARATLATYKADERYTNNFKPVLYPIYQELLQQISLSKTFLNYGANSLGHTKYDRLYWGRDGLYKNDRNVFNDFLDCIEIKGLQLKLNLKNC